MKQTISMRIRRMHKVLHIVDDARLEAFAAGQDTTLPPVHAIPERRVQVQNVHFYVLHGWTVVVPLSVVECGLSTVSPSPPVPVGDAGSSTSAPMDVDLVVPPPPRPTTTTVACRSPSPPTLVVVGTIAARRGQLLAPLMPRTTASSSLATAQTGWPHLPPQMGGPNGPLSGWWWLPPRRPVGGRGGGAGIQPLRGRHLEHLRCGQDPVGPWRLVRRRTGPWQVAMAPTAVSGTDADRGMAAMARCKKPTRRLLGERARPARVLGTRLWLAPGAGSVGPW